MKKIKIMCAGIELDAELNTSSTAQKIVAALPLTGTAMRWGAEVYFSIPVQLDKIAF